MSRATLKAIQAAAGNAGEAVYVDDVFSTYVYDGTGSAQTITNGIDLDGEGGLVWIKNRDQSAGNAQEHILSDTERGVNKHLSTNNTDAEESATRITAFNTNGFSVSNSTATGYSGWDYTSWTFRKQPGFFDVVTYTGNGTNRTINHNLGSTPGMIIIKCTSGAFSWAVWHRGMNTDSRQYLWLNSTQAVASRADYWNTSDPTDSFFPLGTNGTVNSNGQTYVAYLFAHDAQEFGTNSDESIIKCGSYTGTGSAGNNVDVGFEPQWIMFKRTNSSSDWVIFDAMRGLTTGGNNGDRYLYPNQSGAEGGLEQIALTPTGFVTEGSWGEVNASGGNYIYVAIRRPHKPASEFAATDLFDVASALSPLPTFDAAFPPDMAIRTNVALSSDNLIVSRLTGPQTLKTNSTDAEGTNSGLGEWDFMEGFASDGGTASTKYAWMFRRAPGFFDVVAYTGDSSTTRNINHNLAAVPELIIAKNRTTSSNWAVYNSADGPSKYLTLERADAATSNSIFWKDTTPTSTVFTVGNNFATNKSGYTHIAYLFATVPGISKVGSYTGTGSDVDVDCGFTNGARFVLIKRTDDAGSWFLYDSVRGIASGNDPYLKLQANSAQATGTDYIDPLSSGFTINSGADLGLNASGGNYIFLAIA